MKTQKNIRIMDSSTTKLIDLFDEYIKINGHSSKAKYNEVLKIGISTILFDELKSGVMPSIHKVIERNLNKSTQKVLYALADISSDIIEGIDYHKVNLAIHDVNADMVTSEIVKEPKYVANNRETRNSNLSKKSKVKDLNG